MPMSGSDQSEWLTRARQQRGAGELEQAEASCLAAIAERPRNAEAHRLLGTVLQLQSRGAAAIDSFRRAVELEPANAKALRHLAIALSEAGKLASAMECGRMALALEPGHVGALYHLARLRRFELADPDLVALEEIARDPDALEPRQQVLLFFTLAKAYEDLGDYARSFECLTRANRLKRAGIQYDVRADLRLFDEIASVFDAELFERFAGAGSASELPILIVGMPRSGTTLVEQILAGHPVVHGAGELGDLHEMAMFVSLLKEGAAGFPDGMSEMPPQDLAELGHGYVARLGRIAPDAARVADKNPTNFRYLGLARLIVPHARVIHCVRDPLDTCLSCYGLALQGTEFGYDLIELGHYYRGYAKLMEHWRGVLPADWVIDVQYEDLVSDIEHEVRRIVAHCGLDWDDKCLDFHRLERTIRTASFAQVRQPLYRDSVGRARRYEAYLRPLLDVLEGEPEARATVPRGPNTF